MPTVESLIEDLKAKGTDQTRKTYVRHGMPAERVLGVSTADMKLVAKTLKGQQDIALALYETGFMESMYIAGMVADGRKMTSCQLQSWAENSHGMTMISEYTVPWVTVENSCARDLAIDWIGSREEHVARSGWCTYEGLLATSPDSNLNLEEIGSLLNRVVANIDYAPNRVKAMMNSFVISVGTYVKPLLADAKKAANDIGTVYVDVGDTACKIRVASEAIAKVEAGGKLGIKKKTIRC